MIVFQTFFFIFQTYRTRTYPLKIQLWSLNLVCTFSKEFQICLLEAWILHLYCNLFQPLIRSFFEQFFSFFEFVPSIFSLIQIDNWFYQGISHYPTRNSNNNHIRHDNLTINLIKLKVTSCILGNGHNKKPLNTNQGGILSNFFNTRERTIFYFACITLIFWNGCAWKKMHIIRTMIVINTRHVHSFPFSYI